MHCVNCVVLEFRRFLNNCWENILNVSDKDLSGSLRQDWYQSNWEILVEGLLFPSDIVLIPYGDGADCNGASSRVLFPSRIPTHELICKPRNGVKVQDMLTKNWLDASSHNVVFDRFVSWKENHWYSECVPFDKVLASYDDNEIVVDLNGLDFYIQKINK